MGFSNCSKTEIHFSIQRISVNQKEAGLYEVLSTMYQEECTKYQVQCTKYREACLRKAGKSQRAVRFLCACLPQAGLSVFAREIRRGGQAGFARIKNPPRRTRQARKAAKAQRRLPAAADGTDLESIALNLLHLREKKINLANLPIKHSGFRIYKDCNSPSGNLQFIS